MTDEVVLRERRGAVEVLTLNRPDRLNAWNGALEEAYFDALEQAAGDPEVRAVVVTGAGRGFCAGADMDLLQDIGSSGSTPRPRRPQTFPLTLEKPVVAAVNGACAGIGLVQALYCDVRFAAAGAKFTTAFARRGLVAEHGISWILPRVVGSARALDLLLSARVVLAEEAFEMGLVNRVCPPEELLDAALAYATDLAEHCSPASMAAMKRQVLQHWDVGLPQALSDSDRLMAASLQADDFREGVDSFVEKRPPRFAPLGR